MTERERKILIGKKIDPVTADEAAIATAIDNAGSGGGGSSLPTVTSDDNGDVLTVVEGAWAKDAPSGGEFVVEFVGGGSDGYAAEHDGEPISIAEIYAAKQSGKTITGHDEHGYTQLVLAALSETIAFFSSSVAHPVAGQYVASFIGTHEDDTDTWVTAEFSLPAPSADANGKVLGVEDGAYALVDHYKPTYEFSFTVSEDQQNPGEYVITPGSGVTYAAIVAAMQTTPNVYAVIDFEGENRYQFTDIDTTSGVVRANGLYYGIVGSDYMFFGLRIKIESDNSCDIDVVPLQTASL